MKYIEISWRNPEGGGVVTITTKAFGPMWGCLGGMLIITSYFLTAAISAVSGLHYIASLLHFIDDHIVAWPASASSRWRFKRHRHSRERYGRAAHGTGGLFSGSRRRRYRAGSFRRRNGGEPSHASLRIVLCRFTTLVVGFAAAWLAFSGLESISQLSPAMRFPLAPDGAQWAMWCDCHHAF